jgi:hypothetical protein
MVETKEAKLASGKKGTFIPSENGNSCSQPECESEFVRVKELDPPERMFCYKHCTSKKREEN